MCGTLTLCVFSRIFFKNFFQNFQIYFFQKFLPKFFPKLRHTASTMVSLVPGLGSRKFATQVVYLSLASLGLVAANSRLHASLTFYVRNPNLVRFFQNFFQKFLPKFFPKLRHTAATMVSVVPGLGSRKFATQVVYLSLASLGLVAANSRLHASFTFYVRNPNLVRFFQNFFQKFFLKFFQYFFQKFLPKFFPKLRHTASTMVSLVPGLGSRKFATQVVYLSLASLGLVAANSRLHASLTFYVRNPNLVLTLCFFCKNFFKNFFQKFFQYFFQKFFPKFFPKLRHTASTMVSLVPGLGSRKFATQVVYLSLASLGLVAANSRLHASLTFYVRNPNLVRFFQNFFQKFFPQFFQYFFQKFVPKFFPKLRHTASTMVSLVPGLGSRKFATQVVYLSLASLGLVAANSRLHASLTFYVRNPNLVRFFKNFFQKFLPKFFPKLRHTAPTIVSLVPGLGSRKFATQVVYLSLASLGLVAANSRLHASLTFYVRNPNLVRFFQKFFQKFFPKFFPIFFSKIFAKIFSRIATHGFYNGIFGPWAW